jgi:calmodulin/calcium-binding protein CML/plastin-2
MSLLDPRKLAELRETFDYNDTDKDGRIDFDEFVALLDDLEADMSLPECQLGFAAIDVDDNGWVSFDEFVDWWSSD